MSLISELEILETDQNILLAARPGMGKTSFALNVVRNLSLNLDIPTAFISLQLKKEFILQRLLSAEKGIPFENIKNSNLSEAERNRFIEGEHSLTDAPIYINDPTEMDIREIRETAIRLKNDMGLSLLIIDYLELIDCSNSEESRKQQIRRVVRNLKNISHELDITILSLAQLNRRVEKRFDKRPRLGDLRKFDKGILDHLDQVWFLSRNYVYSKNESEKNAADLEVISIPGKTSKNHHLKFEPKYLRFEDAC